jgi:hypothetical protein
MNFDIETSFKEKLYECKKHVEKITVSRKYLSKYMPMTVETYSNLNDIDMSFIDQLIFRYSKLQDTLGEKIFPSILILSKEDVKRKTFIDILNRLEELEIVDKNEWLKLIEIRNEIAHEYSFNRAEVVESIANVYNVCKDLIRINDEVNDFCQEKLF